jgi:hypothetical protein
MDRGIKFSQHSSVPNSRHCSRPRRRCDGTLSRSPVSLVSPFLSIGYLAIPMTLLDGVDAEFIPSEGILMLGAAH